MTISIWEMIISIWDILSLCLHRGEPPELLRHTR